MYEKIGSMEEQNDASYSYVLTKVYSDSVEGLRVDLYLRKNIISNKIKYFSFELGYYVDFVANKYSKMINLE
jgi:hypothetical protein